MEEKRNIEEIILNGTEDELAQLRLWLFKEAVRLENQESALSERDRVFASILSSETEAADFKSRAAAAISETADLEAFLKTSSVSSSPSRQSSRTFRGAAHAPKSALSSAASLPGASFGSL